MSERGISVIGGAALAFSSIIGAGVLFVPREIHDLVPGNDVEVILGGFVLSVGTSTIIASLSFDGKHHGRNLPQIINGEFKRAPPSLAPILLSLALLLGLPVATIYAAQVIDVVLPGGGGHYLIFAPLLLLLAVSVGVLHPRLSVLLQIWIVSAICIAALLMVPQLPSSWTIGTAASPRIQDIGTAMLMGVLAFTGLENMPAMARHFRAGRLAFFLAMVLGALLALGIYLLVLALVGQQATGTYGSGVEWLRADRGGGQVSLMGGAAVLMVLAVLGNVITWNIGVTETWILFLGLAGAKGRLKVQSVIALGYFTVLFAVLSGRLSNLHAIAQAGAIFGSIYILLALACLRGTGNLLVRGVALATLLIMVAILSLTPIYLVLPLLTGAALILFR